MKVLFVKPRLDSTTLGGLDYSLCEPLEFESLAAALPDHDVEILDLRFDPRLEERVRRFRPDVVGTTSMSVNVYAAREILARVKGIDPSITTLVGGYHPTVAPEDFAEPYVDAVALGQAVDTIRDVMRAIEKRAPLRSVPGLALPAGRGVVERTPPRSKVFDLDAQPIPNRRLNPEHRRHYFCEYWQPAAIMRASIGCHGRCNFCALWDLTDGKYLVHSVRRVADEIESIPEKYIFFIDDNFIPPGHDDRIERLRREIAERNLKKEYYFSTRADGIARNPGIVERWVEVGLRRMFFGLESHDDERLRGLNKGIPADLNRRAVEICRANGVDVTGCFIINPDFTRDDFLRVYEYATSLRLNVIAYLVLTPHPGTVLHAMRRHEITSRNYGWWDHLHAVLPTALPERDFYDEYARLWMRTYTPATWDGAKRLVRLLSKATWAQRKFLLAKAATVFPKIALGAVGSRPHAYANWLEWAGSRRRQNGAAVSAAPEVPVLPSLEPASLSFVPESALEPRKARLVSKGRRLDRRRAVSETS
ncbi:MAG: cobalamin B12-binding domain-containing protein [Planctomycetes bacterium]|nr:cobalamin B12-binding domain-containing protein [Planctomycetota bacterium]